jgi:hypothetical protein
MHRQGHQHQHWNRHRVPHRDVEEIRAVGCPVWAMATCPRSSGNELTFDSINKAIKINGSHHRAARLRDQPRPPGTTFETESRNYGGP